MDSRQENTNEDQGIGALEAAQTISEFLTRQLNEVVQDSYPSFPELVVFVVPGGNNSYAFDARLKDQDEVVSPELLDEVITRARLWIKNSLDAVLKR